MVKQVNEFVYSKGYGVTIHPKVELNIQGIIKKITLFADGELGTPILSKHWLRKDPFSMSDKAAFINGKHTSAASLKSLSLLPSFFLNTYMDGVLLAHLAAKDQSYCRCGNFET
jgi:hypothetical protein